MRASFLARRAVRASPRPAVGIVAAGSAAEDGERPQAWAFPRRRVLLRMRQGLCPPSSVDGLTGAALTFGASLVPSLYPRPWTAQGVLSGVALALGYGLGCAVGGLARGLRLDRFRGLRTLALVTAAVLAAAVVVAAFVANYRWQLDVRALMGADGSPAIYLLAIVPLASLTGYAVVVLARAVRLADRAYRRGVARLVRQPMLTVVRLLVPMLVTAVVLDGLVAGPLTSRVQRSLAAADASTDPGVSRPDSVFRSGGPGSLVAWDTLGRMGRRFVSAGPEAGDLTSFNGTPARPPVRVYVGLGSATTDQERAALAVAELERTGGFLREVLIVITPTGTGSVNRFAVDPLEYMYNGNTAAVVMQYSYAPSWLRMLGNQDRAKEGAQHLFDAVIARVHQMPDDSRPAVLLYGESLGSFGSESLFERPEDIQEPVQGVLWVGPPRANRLWQQLTARRDPGSPVWRPVYEGGKRVRFATTGHDLGRPLGPWAPPRVAYLQHASDPVTWLGPDLILRRPAWLEEPRGPGVSDRVPYLPGVTFAQTAVDMVLGAHAPVGHGHIYGPEQASAWALIAPPANWQPEETRRLVELFAANY